jgi:MscS family membrane protein
MCVIIAKNLTEGRMSMELSPQVQDALGRLVAILLIIIVTLILRRVAPYIARNLLNLIWRAANVVRGRNDRTDAQITQAIIPPMRLLILVIGLQFILLALDLPDFFLRFRADLIDSLISIVFFWALIRLLDVLVDYLEQTERLSMFDSTLAQFGRQLSKLTIILVGFVVIVGYWGLDLAGLIAGLGIGGLAVALAAQDALANLIGYLVILTDNPFKVGHYVQIEDEEGYIEQITLRSTRLRRRDRAVIIIPNKTVVDSILINFTTLEKRQVNMILGVTYDTSAEKLQLVIEDIKAMLGEHRRVTPDRPLIEFVEFGGSSLNIMVVYFARTVIWQELQRIKADVNFHIMAILEAHGVSVAFPTRTVNFDFTAEDLMDRMTPRQEVESS